MDGHTPNSTKSKTMQKEQTSARPEDILISALKERHFSIGKEELESAFQTAADGVQNADWVVEHLNPDTLLTKEELTQYVGPRVRFDLISVLTSQDI